MQPDQPSEAQDDIVLRVHVGPAPKPKIQDILFDSGQTWALYQSHGKYVLQNDSLDGGSHPNRVLIMESDFKSGDMYFTADSLHKDFFSDPLGYPLNQILMILLLSRHKGMTLHACGVSDEGRGYLFLGYSGDGKSTMANLWSENRATILNDDRIVIREKGDAFWMYGTPWHGDFKEWSSQGMPVRKMFFLSRGAGNVAVPKQGAEAVSMILARSFPPLWDEEGMAYTVDLCHRMVDKVPCYQLSFSPDKGVLEFVRDMGEQRKKGDRGGF
jgi:hypothetical protein